MALEMRLELKLAQKLVMTPQLQQAIRLLQLSRLEMTQEIQMEMLENPVLEEVLTDDDQQDDPTLPRDSVSASEEPAEAPPQVDVFDLKWDSYIDNDTPNEPGEFYDPEEVPSYEHTLSHSTTLAEHLRWQLRLTQVTSLEKRIGEMIIGNIDDDGYLRDVSVEDLARSSGVKTGVVEKALRAVQDLDPPGVGARTLQECLLIQARQLGFGGTVVEKMISGYMDDLEKKRYHAIARSLKAQVADVVAAANAIESLEPKPGRPFVTSEVQYIVPDVYVVKKGGDYVILLNDEGIPRLKVSPLYKKLMRGVGDESTREYIESKIRSARWLLKSIEQRNRTVYRVTESIVKRQREFLDKGAGFIKPMILRDVAEDIEMHESTISRVTTNKYMHTPQGIFELKYFFAGCVSGDNGEETSTLTVRKLIEKAIREEDPARPMNDRAIVDMLMKKNIHIARRTVAKYRCEMKIPPAGLRKKPY
ncbi:MAG TPA: RNA polymerase factor sigma-54 [Nitrospirota bacterium]|jgi:RNA polymerase sigma-54 factor